ncbi:hypothetical protein CYMTET_44900 [Cymbomonas tetramitiformis]|uniref:D-isomer specific 2-hydroxyacid dehydrogenase NAD-binding domain-containing protein n=1 Tax=Cymbomonas tetramitiformis TaxID=36881 RepID=A0AAE0BZB6_9CHLO|nr:hypothetical protein CYMTET_44900 [Cymbomonas tetramitiformis]|eukprot:gene15026-17759_t
MSDKKCVIALVIRPDHPVVAKIPKDIPVEFIVGNDLSTFTNHQLFSQVEAVTWIPDGLPGVQVLDDLYQSLPSVKWIHAYSAGVDVIAPFIRERLLNSPTVLTNGRSAFSSSLAEYVMAMALHFNKQVVRCQENKAQHKWEKYVMPVLKGKTMCFVGFGSIAQATAKIAKDGFGMKVLAVRRNVTKDDTGLAAEIFSNEERLAAIEKSDFVVCSLPGTSETLNFMGVEEFSAMSRDAYFISVGRGAAVDEEALVEALNSDKIAGAALDVYKKEPLPTDHALWDTKNLVMTSHNADYTEDYFDLGWDVWRKNFEAFSNKTEWFTPVDKSSGY